MPMLAKHLILDTCPHCGRANPTLQSLRDPFETKTHNEQNPRYWVVYACNTCGGVVIAGGTKVSSQAWKTTVKEVYPSVQVISDAIPEKARELLRQAQSSLHTPVGAIMISASAVDAMLKEKGYTDGSLYERIDKAVEDGLITKEMAQWAHQIRLDANEQRHPGEDAGLPSEQDGKLVFDFAISFAEYLFVLPSKVSRGIKDSTPTQKPT